MAGEQSKKKLPLPHDLYSGPLVTIKVGLEEDLKNFCMHHSEYFQGALGSENLKEGATGEVELKDVARFTFGLLSEWLYKQTLSVPHD
ncbi:hypothetical protein BU23DRAFT_559207 [Bimuria novae-zelandiae CBS 107.79]|uniref:BTB domain-containing protein n=1 Tax=Bimuria novae-zelandiae CBS 107.79 TaxID=1447943 RepID=A0A6A5UT55_9PLEO|nr:hypothetical protein BU23DRAFT_559207 [Bimuria novae-zelandiae CBS 107.79]